MKQFLKYVKVFFLLQLFLIIFGVISTLIPNSSVRKNIESSVGNYHHEGIYPRPFINEHGHQSDLFMDYMIIDIIYNSSPHKPLKYFLLPRLNFNDIKDQGVQFLNHSITHRHEEPNVTYGRYWQGSSFFYKILFVVCDISYVRWTLFMIVTLTLFAFYQKLVKTLSRPNTLFILSGLIFVNYYLIFTSLQFAPVFLITFLGSIVLINKNLNNKQLGTLFMILGGLTTYFDLLTAPLITLGIPLLIWVCMLPQTMNFKSSFIKTIVFSILWSIGYVFTWLFKWVLIWAFTDYSIIDEVTGKLEEKSSVLANLTRFHAIGSNIEIIYFLPLIVSVSILIILVSIYFNRRGIVKAALMLIIALMPIVWIYFTAHHAETHSWFTYRNLWITVSGIFLALSALIRWEDVRLPFMKKQKSITN